MNALTAELAGVLLIGAVAAAFLFLTTYSV